MTLDAEMQEWHERVLEAMIGPIGGPDVIGHDDPFRRRMLDAARVIGPPPIVEELVELLGDIVRVDATRYEHHQPRGWDGCTPREAGLDGTRWLEPREIARAALRRLGRKLPDAIEEAREQAAAEDKLWNEKSTEVTRFGRWKIYALEGRLKQRVLWEQDADTSYVCATLIPGDAVALASLLSERMPAFDPQDHDQVWAVRDHARDVQRERERDDEYESAEDSP